MVLIWVDHGGALLFEPLLLQEEAVVLCQELFWAELGPSGELSAEQDRLDLVQGMGLDGGSEAGTGEVDQGLDLKVEGPDGNFKEEVLGVQGGPFDELGVPRVLADLHHAAGAERGLNQAGFDAAVVGTVTHNAGQGRWGEVDDENGRVRAVLEGGGDVGGNVKQALLGRNGPGGVLLGDKGDGAVPFR